ncbi:unnamed protein product, partial [Closterium sp. NIES-54]
MKGTESKTVEVTGEGAARVASEGAAAAEGGAAEGAAERGAGASAAEGGAARGAAGDATVGGSEACVVVEGSQSRSQGNSSRASTPVSSCVHTPVSSSSSISVGIGDD